MYVCSHICMHTHDAYVCVVIHEGMQVLCAEQICVPACV